MPRCSCAGNSCSCTLQAGPGLVISGTGNNSAPFTISLAAQYSTVALTGVGALDLSGVSTGGIVEVALSASATSVVLPTGAAGMRIELFVKQVVAGRTITWPASIKWPGGVAPVLSTTINYGDWLVLRQLQSGWIGAVQGAAIR